MPSVSVVVPCYGYGKYLSACVESLLNQRNVEVRVLIIDDCSPDDSFKIATRIADGSDRVEVRRHERNHGHIATYNEGLLEWAQGEFSVLISADDLLTPGALDRAVSVMYEYPTVGMVYGHAINWTDSRALPTAREAQSGTRIWAGHDWIRTVCELGHNIVTSPEVVVRTSIQKNVGGYRPELSHSGDLEMWLRIASVSDVAFIEGADQAYYRIHAKNMTVSRSPVIDLEQRLAAFDSFFSECGTLIRDADQLRRVCGRQIAREALWRAVRAYDKGIKDAPIESLRELAARAYRDSETLREYRAVQRRARGGVSLERHLKASLPEAAWRRLRTAHWRRRWRQRGY